MAINQLSPTTLQTFNQMATDPKKSSVKNTSQQKQTVSPSKDTVDIKSGLGQAIKGGLTGLVIAGIGTEVATTLLLGKHAMGPILAAHAAIPVAVAGAVAGGVIATSTDSKALGALGGAMVGAIAGGKIGMPGIIGGAIGGGLAGLAASYVAERVEK